MPPPFHLPSHRHQRGVGLLIALVAVLLVSVLVIAFLSRSQQQRATIESSGGRAKAAELALAARGLVVQDLVDEIVAGSVRTPSSPSLPVQYLTPNNQSVMLPAQSGLVTTGTLARSMSASLFKTSSTSPLWPTSSAFAAAGPVRAYAGNNSSQSPRVGQPLARRTWDAPRLTPRPVFTDGTITTPDWILLARQGPVGPNNLATADLAKFSSRAASNPLYVIGRYAFTVYEVGGLLDANLAGTHSAATLTRANQSAKTTQAMADLTALPVSMNADGSTGTTLSRAQADDLVRWRNLLSYNSSALTAEQKEALSRGLLNPKTGEQTWIGRQDLIDFWQKRVASPSDQQAGLAFLTTFSRGLNQPSVYPPEVAPLASFDKTDPAQVARYNHNAPFLSVRVNTAFTRADGTQAVPGEPLVLKKFPLSKIKSDLEDASGVLSTGSPTHKLFGLTRTGANEPWNYDPALLVKSPPVSTGAPSFFRLKTLAEVRNENREPNFFELLQAAILSGANGNIATGSLGSYLGFENTESLEFEDGVLGRQVLQIGANIIDQYDADGFPSQIYVENNPYYDVYGIEDLPYLHAVYQLIYRFASNRNGPPETASAKLGFYFMPVLWNPHRLNPDASPAAKKPTEFRFRADSVSSVKGASAFVFLDLKRYKDLSPFPYPNRLALAGSQSSNRLSRLGKYTGTNEDDYGKEGKYDFLRPGDKGWKGKDGTPTGGGVGAENLFFQFDPFGAKFRKPDHLAGQLIPDTEIQTNYATCEVKDKNEKDNTDIHFYALNYAVISDVLTATPRMQRSDGQDITSTVPGSTRQPFLEEVRDYPNGGHFGPENTTFTLDFKDAGGIWRPYSKIRRVTGGRLDQSREQAFNAFGSGSATVFRGNIDPRTDRFGAIFNDSAWNTFRKTFREVPATNSAASAGQDSSYTPSLASPQNRTQFNVTVGATISRRYGLLSQNRATPPIGYTGTNVAQTYITDPDGVARGGDSFRAGTGGNTEGYVMGPIASLATNPAQPVVLNRPFESVAEMGYAFRGQPWKSVDFFTSTSADLALLDVFSVYDAPLLVGGQLNVNTVEAPVLKAILSGIRPDPVAATAGLSADDVKNIANRLVARRDNTSIAERDPLADLPGPYMDAVNFFSNPSLIENWAVNNVKIHSEAVVRSLADYSQSRVWNLMIDLTVESGSYTQNSSKLSEFSVNGVNRVWVHLALDRFTGKVLEQRIEVVTDTPL